MVRLLNVKQGAVRSTYYMVKSYRFKFPNFRIGPCGISSAYRAHFPPLIVRARVRIIPCGFRSIWCGNSAVNGAEIPHDRCISAAYHAISAGHSALPHVAVRKFRTVQFGNLHLYENRLKILSEISITIIHFIQMNQLSSWAKFQIRIRGFHLT